MLEKQKNKAAQELGKLGAAKGGRARAAKLSSERRSEIARKAAKARGKPGQAHRRGRLPPDAEKDLDW